MIAAPIERATADDVVSLATDVGSAPMQVGAVLLLDTSGGFDLPRATATIAERIQSIPRLRQRLVHTPFGCGRPIWIDDTGFDLADHVAAVECPAPGDEHALLAIAAEVIDARLPSDRPLWRLTFVPGLSGRRTAMIIAFHHVLADGVGGLAVLGNLVDGAPTAPVAGFPRPQPSAGRLARDAARTRLALLAQLPTSLRRMRAAITQLRPAAAAHAVRCSLNRPTGARRQFAVVRADLDAILRLAHERGATVNDVALTAIAAALHTLLLSRGESVDRFVVSVPVSARQRTTASDLGNQVGAIPIEVRATGPLLQRLDEIAVKTRAAKTTSRAASAALLGPIFRLLARVGIFSWFINRQRLVHSFVTNLRGPDAQLSFLGAAIVDVIAVAVVTGNVTISFAMLSYAGTLDITVIADPDACPDVDTLRDALQTELDRLIAANPT